MQCDIFDYTVCEPVKLIYNNHQDCKECLLYGTIFIPDTNSQEYIKQYNLVHPKDTLVHSIHKVLCKAWPLSYSFLSHVNAKAHSTLEFSDPNYISDGKELIETNLDCNLDERDDLFYGWRHRRYYYVINY